MCRTPTDESAELAALGGGRHREPLTKSPAARVDAQLPSGLGVDEVQEADVRELLLSRIPTSTAITSW